MTKILLNPNTCFEKMFETKHSKLNIRSKFNKNTQPKQQTYTEALTDIFGQTDKDAFNLTHNISKQTPKPDNNLMKDAEKFFSASLQFIKNIGK